jgi:hypothetical protein
MRDPAYAARPRRWRAGAGASGKWSRVYTVSGRFLQAPFAPRTGRQGAGRRPEASAESHTPHTPLARGNCGGALPPLPLRPPAAHKEEADRAVEHRSAGLSIRCEGREGQPVPRGSRTGLHGQLTPVRTHPQVHSTDTHTRPLPEAHIRYTQHTSRRRPGTSPEARQRAISPPVSYPSNRVRRPAPSSVGPAGCTCPIECPPAKIQA